MCFSRNTFNMFGEVEDHKVDQAMSQIYVEFDFFFKKKGLKIEFLKRDMSILVLHYHFLLFHIAKQK